MLNKFKRDLAYETLINSGFENVSVETVDETVKLLEERIKEVLNSSMNLAMFLSKTHLTWDMLHHFIPHKNLKEFNSFFDVDKVLFFDTLPVEEQIKVYKNEKLLADPLDFAYLVGNLGDELSINFRYNFDFVVVLQIYIQNYLTNVLKVSKSIFKVNGVLGCKDVFYAGEAEMFIFDDPVVIENPTDFSTNIIRTMNSLISGAYFFEPEATIWLSQFLNNLIFFLVVQSKLLIILGNRQKAIDSSIISSCFRYFPRSISDELYKDIYTSLENFEKISEVIEDEDTNSARAKLHFSCSKVYERMKRNSLGFRISDSAVVAVTSACETILVNILFKVTQEIEDNTIRVRDLQRAMDLTLIKLSRKIKFRIFSDENYLQNIKLKVYSHKYSVVDTVEYKNEPTEYNFPKEIIYSYFTREVEQPDEFDEELIIDFTIENSSYLEVF